MMCESSCDGLFSPDCALLSTDLAVSLFRCNIWKVSPFSPPLVVFYFSQKILSQQPNFPIKENPWTCKREQIIRVFPLGILVILKPHKSNSSEVNKIYIKMSFPFNSAFGLICGNENKRKHTCLNLSCVCVLAGGSWGSFLRSELPGLGSDQHSQPQEQLLRQLQLQDGAEGGTHVLPPRSGRTSLPNSSVSTLTFSGFFRPNIDRLSCSMTQCSMLKCFSVTLLYRKECVRCFWMRATSWWELATARLRRRRRTTMTTATTSLSTTTSTGRMLC